MSPLLRCGGARARDRTGGAALTISQYTYTVHYSPTCVYVSQLWQVTLRSSMGFTVSNYVICTHAHFQSHTLIVLRCTRTTAQLHNRLQLFQVPLASRVTAVLFATAYSVSVGYAAPSSIM
eukprot:Lankesteria_metandrocarpae@DN5091_c0_g1_i1.p1